MILLVVVRARDARASVRDESRDQFNTDNEAGASDVDDRLSEDGQYEDAEGEDGDDAAGLRDQLGQGNDAQAAEALKAMKKDLQNTTISHVVPSLAPVGVKGGSITTGSGVLSRLLHQRLGHPHFEALKKTIEASEGSLIPVKKLVDPDDPCISCELSKAKTFKPKDRRTDLAQFPGQFVHADVTKVKEEGIGQQRWLVVMLDEYSGRIHAGSFSYKGDCNRCITDQLKWYRNQTGRQLKRITVDNGTDVNIQELTAFVRSVGADIRTSPTYSPAQNGRSERTVKAMLLLQLRTSKLQAKGEEGILVGYSGHHLYRVWVKERKQVVTSNSLHIFEDLSNDDVDVMRSWPKGVWRKSKKLSVETDERGHLVDTQASIEDIQLEMPAESTNKGGASAELTTLGDVSGMQDFSPVESSERRGRPPKARPLLPMTHDEVLAIIDHDSEQAELASWMTDYADHVCEVYAVKRSTKKILQQDPHVFPTLKAAMDGGEAGAWQDAIAVEIDQLIQMDVLAFVEQLPKGKRAIDLKWVLQRKLGAQLEEVKKKARLVARGFMQRLGLDYAETKAFTSGADSWRMLLALAVLMDWVLRQLDIVAAFLYGILKEDIYARQPPMMSWYFRRHPEKAKALGWTPTAFIWLRRALYGLKQAGRQWQLTLFEELRSHGYKAMQCDQASLVGNGVVAVSHVDDMLYAGAESAVDAFEKAVTSKFKTKLLGQPEWLLGMDVLCTRGEAGEAGNRDLEVIVSQKTYLQSILEKEGMLNANAVLTPIEKKLTLGVEGTDKVLDEDGKLQYGKRMGKLNYLATMTRPDLSFAISQHSKYLQAPCEKHMQTSKRMLRYLVDKGDYGLSSWGFVVLMAGAPVSWASRRHKTAIPSTAESEYVAAYATGQHLRWIANFVHEAGFDSQIQLYGDNEGALKIAHSKNTTTAARHFMIKVHTFREQVREGFLRYDYVHTANQLADIFTKALPAPAFQRLGGRMLHGPADKKKNETAEPAAV
ncbi:Copia protease [Ceratocystis lukuohia]|uniref:Copia protease n=1 Tax=Ceratocystis lukuohia TaxID=2019550 RepID=A0ABR4MHF0_9PEZI